MKRSSIGYVTAAGYPALAAKARGIPVWIEILIEHLVLDKTFGELQTYCERVASAVGLACIHIWGFRGPEAFEPARQAGVALQLTNILRDLKEDAAAGRVYLPLADLRAQLLAMPAAVTIVFLDACQSGAISRIKGAIIDERFNAGGQVADYFVEVLGRHIESYWAPRYGVIEHTPNAAIYGPKVMIANEVSGSGGDALPSVYSGTLVTAGQGIAEVVNTGGRTELGKIGTALQIRIRREVVVTIEEKDASVKTVGAAARRQRL